MTFGVDKYVFEDFGTFQIKDKKANDSLLQLKDRIMSDIKDRKYIEVSNTEYADISYDHSEQIYKLTYDCKLDWIIRLNVYLIIGSSLSYKGLSYIESSDYTMYGKNKIVYGSIGLYNIDENNSLEHTVLHELKHLYTDFLEYSHSKYRSSNNDLNTKILSSRHIDMSNTIQFDIILQHIQKDNFAYSDFMLLLNNSIYMLNNKEIESFKENIFCELKENNCAVDRCATIVAYKNIEKFLLLCLSDKLSDGLYKYTRLQKNISFYRDVFYRNDVNKKYSSLDFVYKKLLDKLRKKAFSQIEKMICFLQTTKDCKL